MFFTLCFICKSYFVYDLMALFFKFKFNFEWHCYSNISQVCRKSSLANQTQDGLTCGHRSFIQEVINMHGAKFERGGGGEGDSFVSMHT